MKVVYLKCLLCVCVCVSKPRLQLLGDLLGFVPLLALDEDVDGLFDEVHVQVDLSGLQTRTIKNS